MMSLPPEPSAPQQLDEPGSASAHATSPHSASDRSTSLLCRRCGYDLAGTPVRRRVLTCPECGLTGRPRDVIRRPVNSLRWWRGVLLAVGPCLISCALATAATFLDLKYGHRWIGPVGLLLPIVGVLSGVVLPPIAAGRIVRPDHQPRTRFWISFAWLAAGWSANLVIVAAMIVLIAPLVGTV